MVSDERCGAPDGNASAAACPTYPEACPSSRDDSRGLKRISRRRGHALHAVTPSGLLSGRDTSGRADLTGSSVHEGQGSCNTTNTFFVDMYLNTIWTEVAAAGGPRKYGSTYVLCAFRFLTPQAVGMSSHIGEKSGRYSAQWYDPT